MKHGCAISTPNICVQPASAAESQTSYRTRTLELPILDGSDARMSMRSARAGMKQAGRRREYCAFEARFDRARGYKVHRRLSGYGTAFTRLMSLRPSGALIEVDLAAGAYAEEIAPASTSVQGDEQTWPKWVIRGVRKRAANPSDARGCERPAAVYTDALCVTKFSI